jgi:COP9 signalosome complex subunit 3
MRKAINALSRGETGILTNLHAIFFRLCLDSKRLDPAMPYLSLDASNCFLNVQQIYRVSCENALLFFYYGGLIKVAMKDFLGAALMFESCVCMPAFAASAIMLESLKKLILLNLILGRPQQLPGYRAPPVQRLSQTKCQKYQVCFSFSIYIYWITPLIIKYLDSCATLQ